MRLERTISTSVSVSEAYGRASTYLAQIGYRQAEGTPLPTFRRGSPFGSMISFTPKHWEVTTTLQVASQGEASVVYAVFEVNTTGQIVTGKENAFWEAELDGLEAG